MTKKKDIYDIISENEYRELDEKEKPIEPADPLVEAVKQKKPYREMSLEERVAYQTARANLLDKYLHGSRETQTGYKSVRDVYKTGYGELYFSGGKKFDPDNLPEDIEKLNYETLKDRNSKKMWKSFGKNVVDGIVASAGVLFRNPLTVGKLYDPEYDFSNDPFEIVANGSTALVENPDNAGKKFTKEYFMNQFSSLGTTVGMAAEMAVEGLLVGGMSKLANAKDYFKAVKLNKIARESAAEQKILRAKGISAQREIENAQRMSAAGRNVTIGEGRVGSAALNVTRRLEAEGDMAKGALIAAKNATINFQFNITENYNRIKSQNPNLDDSIATKLAYEEAIDQYWFEMGCSALINYSQQRRLSRIANKRIENTRNAVNSALSGVRSGLVGFAGQQATRKGVSKVADFFGNMAEEGLEEIMEDNFAALGRKNQYEANKEMYDRLGIELSKNDYYSFDKAFDSFFGGFIGGGILGGGQLGLKYVFGAKGRKEAKKNENIFNAVKKGFADNMKIEATQFLNEANELNELQNIYQNKRDITMSDGRIIKSTDDDYDQAFEEKKNAIRQRFNERANASHAMASAEMAIKISLSGDDTDGAITDNIESQRMFVDAIDAFEGLDTEKKSKAIELVAKLSDIENEKSRREAAGEDVSDLNEQYAEAMAELLNEVDRKTISVISQLYDTGIIKKTENGFEYDEAVALKAKNDAKNSILITDLFNESFASAWMESNNDIAAAIQYAKQQVNRFVNGKESIAEMDDIVSKLKTVFNEIQDAELTESDAARLLDMTDTAGDFTEDELKGFTQDQLLRKRKIAILRAFFESINGNHQFDALVKAMEGYFLVDSMGNIVDNEMDEFSDKVSKRYYETYYEAAKSIFGEEKMKKKMDRIAKQMNKSTCFAHVQNLFTSPEYENARKKMTVAQMEHLMKLLEEGDYESLYDFIHKIETGTEDMFDFGDTVEEAAEKEQNDIEYRKNRIQSIINEDTTQEAVSEIEAEIEKIKERTSGFNYAEALLKKSSIENEIEGIHKSNNGQISDEETAKRHELASLYREIERYESMSYDIKMLGEKIKYIKGEIAQEDIDGWNEEIDKLQHEVSEITNRIYEREQQNKFAENTINDIERINKLLENDELSLADRALHSVILQNMNAFISYDSISEMNMSDMRKWLSVNINDENERKRLEEDFKKIQQIRNETKKGNARHDFQTKLYIQSLKEKQSDETITEDEQRRLADLSDEIDKKIELHPLFLNQYYKEEYERAKELKQELSSESESKESRIKREKRELDEKYGYDYDNGRYKDQQLRSDGTFTEHHSDMAFDLNKNKKAQKALYDWLSSDDSKDMKNATDGAFSEMGNAGRFFTIKQKDEDGNEYQSETDMFDTLYKASVAGIKAKSRVDFVKNTKKYTDALKTPAGQMAFYYRTELMEIAQMRVVSSSDAIKKITRLERLRSAIERRGAFKKGKKDAFDYIFGDVDAIIDDQVNRTRVQGDVAKSRESEIAKQNDAKENDIENADASRVNNILTRNLTADQLKELGDLNLADYDTLIKRISELMDAGKIDETKGREIIKELKRDKRTGKVAKAFNKLKEVVRPKEKQSQQAEQQQAEQQQQNGTEKIDLNSKMTLYLLDEYYDDNSIPAITKLKNHTETKLVEITKDDLKSFGIDNAVAVFVDGNSVATYIMADGKMQKINDSSNQQQQTQQPDTPQQKNVVLNNADITIRLYDAEPATSPSINDILNENPLLSIIEKIKAFMLTQGNPIELETGEIKAVVMEKTGCSESDARTWIHNMYWNVYHYIKNSDDIYDYYSRLTDWTHDTTIARSLIVESYTHTKFNDFIKSLEAKAKENGIEIKFNVSQQYADMVNAMTEANKQLADRLAEIEAKMDGVMSRTKNDDNFSILQEQNTKNNGDTSLPVSQFNDNMSDSPLPSIHIGNVQDGIVTQKYTIKGEGIISKEGVEALVDIADGSDVYFDTDIDKIIEYNLLLAEEKSNKHEFKEEDIPEDENGKADYVIKNAVFKVYADQERKICIGFLEPQKYFKLIKHTKLVKEAVKDRYGKIHYFHTDAAKEERERRRQTMMNNMKLLKESIIGGMSSVKTKNVSSVTKLNSLEQADKEFVENGEFRYLAVNNTTPTEGRVIKQSRNNNNLFVISDNGNFDVNSTDKNVNVEVPVIKGVQAYFKKDNDSDGVITTMSNDIYDAQNKNFDLSEGETTPFYSHIVNFLKKTFVDYLISAAKQSTVNANAIAHWIIDNEHANQLGFPNDFDEIIDIFKETGDENYSGFIRSFGNKGDVLYIKNSKVENGQVALTKEKNRCPLFIMTGGKIANGEAQLQVGKEFYFGFNSYDFGDQRAEKYASVSDCKFTFINGEWKAEDITNLLNRMYDRILSERALNSLKFCEIDIPSHFTSHTAGRELPIYNGLMYNDKTKNFDLQIDDKADARKQLRKCMMFHSGKLNVKINDSESVEMTSGFPVVELSYGEEKIMKRNEEIPVLAITPEPQDLKRAESSVLNETTTFNPPASNPDADVFGSLNGNKLLNADVYIERYDLSENELSDISKAIVKECASAYLQANGRFLSNASEVINKMIRQKFQDIKKFLDDNSKYTDRNGKELSRYEMFVATCRNAFTKPDDTIDDATEKILKKFPYLSSDKVRETLENVGEAEGYGGDAMRALEKYIVLSLPRTINALFGNEDNVYDGYINEELSKLLAESAQTITVDHIIEAQEFDKPVWEYGKESYETSLMDTLPNELKVFFSIVPVYTMKNGVYEKSNGKDGSITSILGMQTYYDTHDVLNVLRMVSKNVYGNFFDFLNELDMMADAGGKYSGMAKSLSEMIKKVRNKELLQQIAYLINNKEACNFIYMHRAIKKDGSYFVSERYALADTISYDVMRSVEKNLISQLEYGKMFSADTHYTIEYAKEIRGMMNSFVRGNKISDIDKAIDAFEKIYGYRFTRRTIEENQSTVVSLAQSISSLFIKYDSNGRAEADLRFYATDDISGVVDNTTDDAEVIKNHPRIIKLGEGHPGSFLLKLVKKDIIYNPESIAATLMTAGKTIQSTTDRTFAQKQLMELCRKNSDLRRFCELSGWMTPKYTSHMQLVESELEGDEIKLDRGLVSISAFSNESEVSEYITGMSAGDNLNLELMFATSLRDENMCIKQGKKQIKCQFFNQFVAAECGEDEKFNLFDFHTRYSTVLDFVDSNKKKAGWWKIRSVVVNDPEEVPNSNIKRFNLTQHVYYAVLNLFDTELKRIYNIIGEDNKRPGEELFLTCTHFNEIEIDYEMPGKNGLPLRCRTLGELLHSIGKDNKAAILHDLFVKQGENIYKQAEEIVRDLINKNMRYMTGMEIDENNNLSFDETITTPATLKNSRLHKSGYIKFDEKGEIKSDFHNMYYAEIMRSNYNTAAKLTVQDIMQACLDFSINSLVNRNFILEVMYGGRYAYAKASALENAKLYSDNKNERMAAYHTLAKSISDNLYKRMAGILTGGNVPDFSIVYKNIDGTTKKEFLDKNGNTWGGQNCDEFMYLLVHKEPIVSPLLRQYISLFYSDDDAESVKDKIQKINDSKTRHDEKKKIIKELSERFPLVKGYMKIDSTDGQEFCTWREALDTMAASGKLGEKDYIRLRRLYSTISKGKASKEDLRWLMRTLQVIKPVYFGKALSANGKRQNVSYIKSSVMPLLPQMTIGTDLDNVRKNLEKFEERHGRNVHLVFDSASKVTNDVESKNILDWNTLKNEADDNKMARFDSSSFKAYRRYYSIQNETDPKLDHKIAKNEANVSETAAMLDARIQKLEKMRDNGEVDAENFVMGLWNGIGVKLSTQNQSSFMKAMAYAIAKNTESENDHEKVAENLISKMTPDNVVNMMSSYLRKKKMDVVNMDTMDDIVLGMKSLLPDKMSSSLNYDFVSNLVRKQNEYINDAKKIAVEMMSNLADINTESNEYTQLDHIVTSGGINKMDNIKEDAVFEIHTSIFKEPGMGNVIERAADIVKSGEERVKITGAELDKIRTAYVFINRNRRMAQFYRDLNLIDDATYLAMKNGESVIGKKIDTSSREFLSKVHGMIVRQLESRGINKNVLKYLGFDEDKFKMPLFFSENAERIELLLQSVIKREISKNRINGGAFYVGTSESFIKSGSFHVEGVKTLGNFIEGHGDPVIWLERHVSNVGKRLMGTRLVKDRDGKQVAIMAECAISPQFTYYDEHDGKEKVIDFYKTEKSKNGESVYMYLVDKDGKQIKESTPLSSIKDGVFLNTNMVDKKLFEMMSLRVPTSGHMSACALKIVAFLPKSMSSTILVPSDHVTQFGEDFDIDKRFCYMPSYYVHRNGKIQKITRSLIDQKKKEFGYDSRTWIDSKDPIKRNAVELFDSLEDELQSNYMTDIYLSVFKSPAKEVQKKICSVIGYAELDDTKDAILANTDMSYEITTPETTGLIEEQIDKRVKAQSGNIGVGVYSNNVVFSGLLQKIDGKVELKDEDLKNTINIRIGNYQFDGNLSNPECNRNIYNGEEIVRTKQIVNSCRQNENVDNIKADLIPYLNENVVTLPFITGCINFGFDLSEKVDIASRYNEQTGEYESSTTSDKRRLDIASLVCVQPIIRHFTDLELASRSSFKQRNNQLQNIIDTLKYFGMSDDEITRMQNNKGFRNGKFYLDNDGILHHAAQQGNGVTLWNYGALTGKYMWEQIRFDHTHYNASNIENQLLALSLFTKVKRESQTLGTYRSLINVNSQGIGKYYMSVTDKIHMLNMIGAKGRYTNIEKMIGVFVKKDNKMNTLPPDDGYVNLPGCDFYIKPTTIEGLTLINTVKANNDVVGDVFGFTNDKIAKLTEDFYDLIADKWFTQDEREYWYRKFRRDFAQYCYLQADAVAKSKGHAGIFKKDSIREERLRLVARYFNDEKASGEKLPPNIDTPFFHNLVKIMKFSLGGLRDNALVQQLEVRSDGLIKFIMKANEEVDVNRFHNEVMSMWQHPVAILNIEGSDYTTRDFVKDLVSFAFIADDMNGMAGLREHIPFEILDELGFIDALWDIWDNLDTDHLENFKLQFLQNNNETFIKKNANDNFKNKYPDRIISGNGQVLPINEIMIAGVDEQEFMSIMEDIGLGGMNETGTDVSYPLAFKYKKEFFVIDSEKTRALQQGRGKRVVIYKKAPFSSRKVGLNVYNPQNATIDIKTNFNTLPTGVQGLSKMKSESTKDTIAKLSQRLPGNNANPVLVLFKEVMENDLFKDQEVSLEVDNSDNFYTEFNGEEKYKIHIGKPVDNPHPGSSLGIAKSIGINPDGMKIEEEMFHCIFSRYITAVSTNGTLDRGIKSLEYSYNAFDKLKSYYRSVRDSEDMQLYQAQLDNIFRDDLSEADQFNEFVSNIFANNISILSLISKFEKTDEYNNDSSLKRDIGMVNEIWECLKRLVERIASAFAGSRITRNVKIEIMNSFDNIYNIKAIERARGQIKNEDLQRMMIKFGKESVTVANDDIVKSFKPFVEFKKELDIMRDNNMHKPADDASDEFKDFYSKISNEKSVAVTSITHEETGISMTKANEKEYKTVGNIFDELGRKFFNHFDGKRTVMSFNEFSSIAANIYSNRNVNMLDGDVFDEQSLRTIYKMFCSITSKYNDAKFISSKMLLLSKEKFDIEGEDKYVKGEPDLIIIHGGNITIVDFKTVLSKPDKNGNVKNLAEMYNDDSDNLNRMRKYALQIEYYKMMASQITGVPLSNINGEILQLGYEAGTHVVLNAALIPTASVISNDVKIWYDAGKREYSLGIDATKTEKNKKKTVTFQNLIC